MNEIRKGRKKVYLILGDGGVGKSTLIRCLTGLRQKGYVYIRLQTGSDISLWAYMRSAQEVEITPDDLLIDITKPNEDTEYFLIPLRIEEYNDCPTGQVYIDLLNKHCEILGAVVLSQDSEVSQMILPISQISIPNSREVPANGNANAVKSGWKWM